MSKMTGKTPYSPRFFHYVESGSTPSAERIVPLIARLVKPRSVLDIGCGTGAWLRAWMDGGVVEVLGVDGAYVAPEQLKIPASNFQAIDIAAPFRLRRKFDLVQCLEVAEHLSSGSSDTLLDNIASHGDVVLFSAAPPGQGGLHHVNERPYEYWRDKFLARGFDLFDAVRAPVRGDARIEPWYRYNTFLFVRRSVLAVMPNSLRETAVPPHLPVPDVAPWSWRMRRRILRWLPASLTSLGARLKHSLRLRS